MIELRTITKENLEEVLNLRVSKHQESFVSSPVYSLAQAYVYGDTAFPFAVYAEGTIVGFIMLGYYEDRKQNIYMLLLDLKKQALLKTTWKR